MPVQLGLSISMKLWEFHSATTSISVSLSLSVMCAKHRYQK